MTDSEKRREIERLEKRLRAAKTRALYWSGNPTFTGRRFSPTSKRVQGLDHSTEYEIALCDIKSLSERLTSLDGKPRKLYDPKNAFQERYSKVMYKLSNSDNPPQ